MRFRVIIFLLLILIGVLTQSGFGDSGKVYVMNITGDIDMGLASFLERGVVEAEKDNAEAIILNIDTFGGLVVAATRMRDAIFNSSVPVITYVTGRAWSAGALIALAGEKLIMAPGTTIGAAETQPDDEKFISALRTEFKATAERRGKNPDIAMAMVDKDISIEGIIERGKLLTLSTTDALQHEFADGEALTFTALLNDLGLGKMQVIRVEPTSVEKFARAVTNPMLSGILLTLGFVGLFLEVTAVGWGVPGTIGLLSLAAFFSGHFLTGASHWSIIILFLAGVFLLLLEVFVVPGFGITGLGGGIAVLASLFMTFPTTDIAMKVMAGSVTASFIAIVIALRFLPRSNVWHRIALATSETVDLGYVGPANRENLLGKEGVTITDCRPSGVVIVDDERVDCVSEGGYLKKGVKVKVVKIEGNRLVVRSLEKEE